MKPEIDFYKGVIWGRQGEVKGNRFAVRNKMVILRRFSIMLKDQTMNKRKKKNESLKTFTVDVNKKMKTHGNDPFFVEGAETSKRIIEKYGFPKKISSGKK